MILEIVKFVTFSLQIVIFAYVIRNLADMPKPENMITEKKNITVKQHNTPCGRLILGDFDGLLCLCDWLTGKHRERTDIQLKKTLKADFKEGTTPVIEEAARQIDEYFAGKRTVFDIPMLHIGTDFRKRVWAELLNIPYGTTISYGQLAQRIDMPTAVRAVANANGANPISIIVPCHRVIGSDGTLTGYGGGLTIKQALLALEKGKTAATLPFDDI